MGNKYLVIGWGFGKKDGKPFSRCARLVEDLKEGTYCFIDTNNCIYLDYHEELGKVITAELKIS